MENQYWIQRGDKTTGPFSDQQFAQMTAAGMIAASDLISTDQVNWTVGESFPSAVAQDKSCSEPSGQDDPVPGHSTEDQSDLGLEASTDSSSGATDPPPRQADANQSQELSQRPQCTIHAAAGAGDIEQIKLHLSWGTDVNVADRVGQSPLSPAVRGSSLGAVELLLANGADVNSKGGADDQTPLHDAVMFSHSNRREIIELLCAMGADVDAKDRWGRTPVSYAGIFDVNFAESADIAKVLVAKGASLIVCDKSHRSPLHHYASNGRTELVELFIRNWRRGPQPWMMNLRDNQGNTPLELAEEGSEVAALLESSGAKRSPIWCRGPLTPGIVRGAAVAVIACGYLGAWEGYPFWLWLPMAIIVGFLVGRFYK